MLTFHKKNAIQRMIERERIILEGVRMYRHHIEDVFIESRVEPDYLTFVKQLEKELEQKYKRLSSK